MTALAMEPVPVASTAQRFVVVVFDGVSLGIMSFAFGVFDLAASYGMLPDIEIRVVAGEDRAALTGGGRYPEHELWEAVQGYLDLQDASKEV